MSQWDMAATRNQIKRLYGHQQLEMAAPALRSVIDRRDYAHYHYHEAKTCSEVLPKGAWLTSR